MTAVELAGTLTLVTVAGGATGFIGGGVGAFLEAYTTHPLARLVDRHGRKVIAMANVSAGSRMGAGCGALAGVFDWGVGSLVVTLMTAAALAITAYVALRRASGEPVIGAVGAVLGGASLGGVAAHLGRLLQAV